MLVDFLEDERFMTRTLVIGGERLTNGFAASFNSMHWEAPYADEMLDEGTRKEIVNKIMAYKFETDFKLTLEG